MPILSSRSSQLAGTLSGGEQQMLAIGRALMGLPRLLILDEPSLGLAPKIVSELFELIQVIRAEGTAILLVEQNVRHALKISDRGYCIQRGEVVLTGTGAELLASADLTSAMLGTYESK
jgi:branched-chain amino acid transport system ATP-binding protein